MNICYIKDINWYSILRDMLQYNRVELLPISYTSYHINAITTIDLYFDMGRVSHNITTMNTYRVSHNI